MTQEKRVGMRLLGLVGRPFSLSWLLAVSKVTLQLPEWSVLNSERVQALGLSSCLQVAVSVLSTKLERHHGPQRACTRCTDNTLYFESIKLHKVVMESFQ